MALYQNDIGVAIEVEVKTGNGGPSCTAVDLTGSDVFLVVEKPSKVVVEWTASVTNGRRGLVQHVTVTGDLNEVGRYNYQVRVEPVAGQVFHSSFAEFEVLDHLTPD